MPVFIVMAQGHHRHSALGPRFSSCFSGFPRTLGKLLLPDTGLSSSSEILALQARCPGAELSSAFREAGPPGKQALSSHLSELLVIKASFVVSFYSQHFGEGRIWVCDFSVNPRKGGAIWA